MLTLNDLVDIVLERLGASLSELAPVRPVRGRPFLSEYEVNKRLAAGVRELRIPKDAIVSPLALDGLALRRVKIVRSA